MPYIKTKELEIYYEISGQGEPIVFIGGITSTVLTWKYQQEEMQKYYQVILFDNRGSGLTKINKSQKISIKLFTNDVLDLLNGLGITKAHILGASMGGMIAEAFVHSYPEYCISLILCCTTWGLETYIKAQPEMVQTMLNRGGVTKEEAEKRALQVVAHPSSFEKRKELLEFYLQTKKIFPHSAEEIIRRNEAMYAFNFWSKLPEIKVPTLVIHGAEDRLIPVTNAETMSQRIPKAELILIPNSGHIFFIEEFEKFNMHILDFLCRLRL